MEEVDAIMMKEFNYAYSDCSIVDGQYSRVYYVTSHRTFDGTMRLKGVWLSHVERESLSIESMGN